MKPAIELLDVLDLSRLSRAEKLRMIEWLLLCGEPSKRYRFDHWITRVPIIMENPALWTLPIIS